MNKSTFARCLKRIREGDINGALPIYDEYYEKFKITAKSILHNDASAEDAASEAMLKIMQYARSTAEPIVENPGAYLYSVVKNVAYDMIDGNKRYSAIDETDECAAADVDGAERAALKQALHGLGDNEFKIVTMFYFYGYKIKEISAALNMPEGTVKWRLTEIRNKLLKKLSED